MITIQNADAALKDYYLDAISSQLNENISPFFAAIEKNSENVYGKDVKLSVVRGNFGSVIAGSEDGDLPAPYKNRYANITLPLKNIYGTIEISDKALRASRESSGAFVNLINAEMEGLISNAKFNFSRMLFGDGTARLFRLKSKVSDSRFVVDKIFDYYVGMQVDVYKLNGDLVGDGTIITAIDKENSEVLFDRDFNNDVVSGYAYVHSSKDNELIGFENIFIEEYVYGYDRFEDPYFCTYTEFCKEKLSEELLCRILDYMEESRNSKINMIICSYKMRRAIAALASANKRIINTIDVHTGFGTVYVNDVPVCAERFCADDRIYFLNTDDFALYQLCDWEWLEDEDGKILKQVPGKAAYSATLVKYAELVCRKPCGQAMLHSVEY